MTTNTSNTIKISRGPGRVSGNGQIIAAVVLGGTPPNLYVSFDSLMDTPDLSDPTLSITVGIEVSFDLGVSFTELASVNWQGGCVDKVTGTWAVPYIHNFNNGPGAAPIDARIIRPFVVLPKAISFGGVLTIVS